MILGHPLKRRGRKAYRVQSNKLTRSVFTIHLKYHPLEVVDRVSETQLQVCKNGSQHYGEALRRYQAVLALYWILNY